MESKKRKVNNMKYYSNINNYFTENNSYTFNKDKKKSTSSYSLNKEKILNNKSKNPFKTKNKIKNSYFNSFNTMDYKNSFRKNSYTNNSNKLEERIFNFDNYNEKEKKNKYNDLVDNNKKYSNLAISWNNVYLNDNIKYLNQNNQLNNNEEIIDYTYQNSELKMIIMILKYYIKVIQNQFKEQLIKTNKNHFELIKKLENQKKYLIKENNILKLKFIELLYMLKDYEKKELEYNKKKDKLFSQIINENKYLRKSNNIIDNNINNSKVDKFDNNDLFNEGNKNLHIRQNTFVNLNNLNDNKNINKINNNKNSFIQNNNAFNKIVNEFTINNKKIKRSKSETKKIEENIINENNVNYPPPSILAYKLQLETYRMSNNNKKK